HRRRPAAGVRRGRFREDDRQRRGSVPGRNPRLSRSRFSPDSARHRPASPVSDSRGGIPGRGAPYPVPRQDGAEGFFMTTAWTLLVTAGLLEIVWAVGLKSTNGFTRPLPSLAVGLAIV